MSKLSNKVGPPVEGADFFGREQEIFEAWSELSDNNHLLITAPRRVGKSSLVKRLIHEARGNNWKTAYIDVQAVTDEIGFFKTFAETIKKENESWFAKCKSKALSSLDELIGKLEVEFKTESGAIKVKWAGTRSSEINQKIEDLLDGTGDFLIVIDELPFFLMRMEKEDEGKERISDFLHQLRAYRQKTHNKIRWIFCGSVGLDTFTEKHNLSESFNDLLSFSISAFDEKTARDFLEKLGSDNHLPLSVDNVDDILNKLGWPLPFFLQLIFKQLKRIKGPHFPKLITKQDVEDAYSRILQETPALKTWEERLQLQLNGDDASHCKAILTHISQDRKGVTRRQLFSILYKRINDSDKCEDKLSHYIKLLERDGYLLFHADRYSFRSPLLRDYWYNLRVR